MRAGLRIDPEAGTVRGYARPTSRLGLFGAKRVRNLTTLKSDRAPEPEPARIGLRGRLEQQGHRLELRAARWAERLPEDLTLAALAGYRFRVEVGDGEERGVFEGQREAERHAKRLGGRVVDTRQGRVVWSARDELEQPHGWSWWGWGG